MSNEIVPTSLMELLTSGRYADVVKALGKAEDEAKGQEKRTRTTIAQRKAALAEAVKSYDVEKLAHVQQIMQDYVDEVARIAPEEPRTLTPAEAHVLMNEAVLNREIVEFVEMRYEAIRELAYMSIDADLTAKGKDATITSGRLAVPTLGKVFCKEGAGLNAPAVDHAKLKELLGEDADLVFKEEVIPEQRVTKFDEEALARLAAEKPEVVEHLRASLIPGKAKTPRFNIRPLKQDD